MAKKKPVTIKKSFRFVGFEAAIDLREAHWNGMDEVKALMKADLENIANKLQPLRFAGMWQAHPDEGCSYFFFGVEVSALCEVPAGGVKKELPESAYAVFKGCDHGAPKYEWLSAAGYKADEAAGFDMEQFDELDIIDGDGKVDWYVPIKQALK